MRSLRLWGWSLPGLVLLALLVVLPALATLPLALLHFDGVSPPRFAGGENLARLWDDPLFWKSLGNSLKVLMLSVPLRLALALGLALLLHRKGPGVSLGRAAALAPGVTPDIAWALVWLFLLNPLYGPVAMMLPLFGVTPDAWLTQPGVARNLLALMTLWLVGEMTIVLIAARQELGTEVYEAARIEGASAWYVFRRVTLPQIRPAIVSASFLSFITSFDELVIAMFLGGSNWTLPKKMFDNIQLEIEPTVAAVSVLQICLVAIVLALAARFGSGAAPVSAGPRETAR